MLIQGFQDLNKLERLGLMVSLACHKCQFNKVVHSYTDGRLISTAHTSTTLTTADS